MPTWEANGTHVAFGSTATTSANVPVPPSVGSNSIILVHLEIEAASSLVVNRPAGFVELTPAPATTGNITSQRLFWKRASANDSGTYNFTWSGSYWRCAVASRYEGCITTGTPFDTGTGAPVSATSSGTSVGSTPNVSLTTTVNDCLVVWIGACYNEGAWTPPTNWTERFDQNTALTIATMPLAQKGSTGNVTGSNVSGQKTARMLALLPVPTAPAGPEPGRFFLGY